jgi:hypothetical protein
MLPQVAVLTSQTTTDPVACDAQVIITVSAPGMAAISSWVHNCIGAKKGSTQPQGAASLSGFARSFTLPPSVLAPATA